MRLTIFLALFVLGRAAAAQATPAASPTRAPNELGRIPVLEYHLIGEREARWSRNWQRFARDLELLHARGYRPITVRQLVRGEIDLPAGLSPVVITFDDASPGQFRYIERSGQLVVDPQSAVGIWDAMAAKHPEWRGGGTFCVLTAASEGHALFGEKGIQGQRSEWRHRKVRELVEKGHEVCNHTLYHVNLARSSAAFGTEQIARAQLAVDSAVSGYRMTSFALPLGEWPADRSILRSGRWTDPRTGREVRYEIDAILMVAGGPSRSPKDPQFDPLRIPRVQVFGDELERTLDQLDRNNTRYVSAGRRTRASRP
ncbi:polysaccharide deacetylase family protein [Pseudogemmatithrix spongiicola]|uniref:Polysaccharide deacetylase family protein n=1 Tax=Pseudogemmatithrix spongiicola TaxID=3062599 RepID=A0AA49JXX9_9BACT|nr:polysaccharide deacetylase family protein [Gemmatimonadaceae bacterium 'strain 138']WKW13909.1 polysaccharide deacetylase family protein [Gemmatimonadaceae bacterium 'strain 318']